MPNTPPQLMASGDIPTSRFVKNDSAADQKGNVCTTNLRPIGISNEGTNYPPLSDLAITALASKDGQYMLLYGDGEVCLITAGDAVVRGNLLKSDATGRGVPILTVGAVVQHHGAVALQSAAAAGEKILCQVQPGSMYPAVYQ